MMAYQSRPGPQLRGPTNVLNAILMALACIVVIAPVLQCQGALSVDKPVIDTNDYFQIPADMIDHFPLVHHTEQNEQSTAFARVIKDSNSWTTRSTPTSILIPTVNTNLSFFYQNSETGTVTKVYNVYSTVADIVYLEHLESVIDVRCDQNSLLTLIFNSSLSASTQKKLRFGLKRAHYTTSTKVAGGQSFYCQSSCSMGDVIFRSVEEVISHSEDPETGFLSSITIKTSAAPSEMLYNSVADVFMNGTVALIPKTNMRVNHNRGRLSWHRYAKRVHHSREESIRLRSAAKLRAEPTCKDDGKFCYGGVGNGYGIGIIYEKVVDLFNMNYDKVTGKAKEPFQSIFQSTDNSVVFGCDNCFAYAGVSFKFRSSLYIGATGLYLKYIELELKGKLAANFNLVAIASTPKSSTKIMYQTSDSTKPLKIVDGVTIFKEGLSSFTTSATFDGTKNIMAFPEDAKLLITMNMGSVTFDAYMALVVDIDVTGSNTFTAQSGAFANADTKVALYVFEKGECEYMSQQEVHDIPECKKVLVAAGVTQAQVSDCTAPTATASKSGKCFLDKYLIVQIFEKPTFRSGLNGPSLKAKTADKVQLTVSVYPIARVTAYKGIFSLNFVPELKAVVKADPPSSSENSTCTGGVEVSAPVLTLNQIYGWVDMKLTIKSIWETCSIGSTLCNMGIAFGIRAPKLLTTALTIPLPAVVTKMFPICASVDKVAPSAGKFNSEKDLPSSLALGTSMTLKDGVPVVKASATISADKDVFPENTEVLGSTGNSKSPKATGGFFVITAKSDAGAGSALTATTLNFKFVADFSGKPTIDVKSAPGDFSILSSSAIAESSQQKVSLRATPKLMFCPKSIADCTDTDWVDEACTAPGCKITGSTVEHSTKKFGTYVLHGSDDVKATVVSTVAGSPNSNSTSSDASAPSTPFNLVLYLAATALALLCF